MAVSGKLFGLLMGKFMKLNQITFKLAEFFDPTGIYFKYL
jgi:hypothetical protein